MSYMEWPADDYAIGSYIQASIADHFTPLLEIKSADCVLDIGCGNGAYSKKIIKHIPQGAFWGIDASANMLELAQKTLANFPKVHLKQADVLTMDFTNQFDYIVSFWCLQWTKDIYKAFERIYQALKPGGKLLTILPAGDDPFITTFATVRDSGEFPSLKTYKPAVDYSQLQNLQEKLATIPYNSLHVKRIPESIILPSTDTFRKFVNGIAFYQGQIAEDQIKLINEAMVQVYIKECKEKYQGESYFNLSVLCVMGQK